MASEFLEYANSKLFVLVNSIEIETDEWGNIQPKKQLVEVETFLKESRGTGGQPVISKPDDKQGANSLRTYLKGYLVNPMQWPGNIRPTECEVEYYGKTGKLQVLSQFPRPFDTELLTGAIVEGWATFQA
ncbi:hypothetical protein [Microcoleus sp. B3-D7]|uniref:hypothetical protein n=1 Tax=Microcoleus sp. B3-D7 TaxID=2818659 RepID=UPI002FD10976